MASIPSSAVRAAAILPSSSSAFTVAAWPACAARSALRAVRSSAWRSLHRFLQPPLSPSAWACWVIASTVSCAALTASAVVHVKPAVFCRASRWATSRSTSALRSL